MILPGVSDSMVYISKKDLNIPRGCPHQTVSIKSLAPFNHAKGKLIQYHLYIVQ